MRELLHEFALYVDTAKAARDRDMTLAWHIAALTRGTKGMPKLQSLLVSRGQRVQSVAQKRAALQMIFGPERERKVTTH